jgi:ribokinase
VVVNPAPVGPDSGRLVTAATVVVVNAGEARQLGLRHEEGPTQPGGAGPMSPGAELVVTLGADGALVGGHHVPAFPAPRVVDSTGAGDAFCGGLAVALAEGAPLLDAVRFGCAAGSCAVGVAGAEPSLPTRALVEAVLGR